MENWQNAIIDEEETIKKAIEVIDASSLQIGLITSGKKLTGLLTDGDVRRAILKGVSLSEPVKMVMKKQFISATEKNSRDEIISLMRQKEIRHIPVLDDQGNIVNLFTLLEFLKGTQHENPILIMAGGLGTRLKSLTKTCPKPMLKIGEKPILETILESFKDQGFKNFYFAVNYKSHVIEEYFQDGSNWNVNISYIKEGKRLGTGGALSLFPETIKSLPIIVMNGDILTKVNFPSILKYHIKSGASTTMCIRDYRLQVPFGVVEVVDHKMIGLQEKPSHNYFVNAGIYVVDPEVLSLIPKDTYFEITTLFQRLIEKGDHPNVFPIQEYWMDIGQVKDYEKANGDYQSIF